jgi:hypothetical protein
VKLVKERIRAEITPPKSEEDEDEDKEDEIEVKHRALSKEGAIAFQVETQDKPGI